eukprot:10852356-Alexandrium_andersonii.AAC.1
MDEQASRFTLPAPEAPEWDRVIARETLDAETGGLVAYQNVCDVNGEFDWNGSLPAGCSRIISRFWCIWESSERVFLQTGIDETPGRQSIHDRVSQATRVNSDGREEASPPESGIPEFHHQDPRVEGEE